MAEPFTSTTCLLLMATPASLGPILMDQIGPIDAPGIHPNNIVAAQDFGAGLEIYDIAAIDDFDNPGTNTISSLEVVIAGWNGYDGVDGIQGLRTEFYSSPLAAGAQLIGDVGHQDTPGPITGNPDWPLAGSDLISVPGGWDLPQGDTYLAIIPVNEFASNGQSGLSESTLGEQECWQANPGGGFGFGALRSLDTSLPYRVFAGGDPCLLALPFCPADLSGPAGIPDGIVSVDDVLTVIGNFGTTGDGSQRPLGDIAPAPAGDCMVTVDDLLVLLSQFGKPCGDPLGPCCLSDGSCLEQVAQVECDTLTGAWLGTGGDCEQCYTPVTGACCFIDATCMDGMLPIDCENQNGLFQGDLTACSFVTCYAPPENDLCEGATPITEGETPFDITWALSNGPDIGNAPCALGAPTIYNDVWFVWTATENSILTVSTCDTANFDSMIAIYEGCTAVPIACNDDDSNCSGHTSTAHYDLALEGTDYYIQIGGFTDQYGSERTGTVSVTAESALTGACCFNALECQDELSPLDCQDFGGTYQGNNVLCSDTSCGLSGDLCELAVSFSEGANAFDTTGVADSGFGEPNEAQCSETSLNWAAPLPDYWAVHTVSANGYLDISLCESQSYDTSMAIYSGASCGQLVQVACNGDAAVESGCQPDYSGVYGLPVTTGEKIWIRIAGWAGQVGIGTCTITWNATLPQGACCIEGECIGVLPATDCAGAWRPGQDCDSVICPTAYQECQTGSGAAPDGPASSDWIAGTSDVGAGIRRAVDLQTNGMQAMTIYGLSLIYDDGWYECVTPGSMEVQFELLDAEDQPVASTMATLTYTTEWMYAGIFPMHGWTATLDYSGQVSSVVAESGSQGEGECWFLWMSSFQGSSRYDDGNGWFPEGYGLNYCVTE